jgi:hypothetical protein
MLCKICSTTITAACHALISRRTKKSPDPPLSYCLHSSFLSFFESITLGCCICRHIWASILVLQGDIGLLTQALEGSIQATYYQFFHQIQRIQNAKGSSDSGARTLSSSDSIRFTVDESGDHFFMTVSMRSIKYLCEFLFFSTLIKVDCLQCFGVSVFEVKGTSAAAIFIK